MKAKLKLAILVSGNGSNMEAIIRACAQKQIDAEVMIVISNNPKAYALTRAKKLNIPFEVLKDETEIAKTLQKLQPDLICLAGFMKILSAQFVKTFSGKMINIHPSLLPQFPGMHAITQAFQARAKETGVTVHYVTEEVDAGPILLQEKVAIQADDTEASLTERIHEAEHRIYPAAIQRIIHRSW